MVISIVMLVYRRVCRLMDGGGLKKKKIKRPQVDAQGNTSQVSTWEHCLWLALKAADFRSPWAGSEGSVWLLTFFLGPGNLCSHEVQRKATIGLLVLDPRESHKMSWVLLLPRDQTLDHLGCHFPLNQRITPGNLTTIQATNWRLLQYMFYFV